jgi:hypothetical protein
MALHAWSARRTSWVIPAASDVRPDRRSLSVRVTRRGRVDQSRSVAAALAGAHSPAPPAPSAKPASRSGAPTCACPMAPTTATNRPWDPRGAHRLPLPQRLRPLRLAGWASGERPESGRDATIGWWTRTSRTGCTVTCLFVSFGLIRGLCRDSAVLGVGSEVLFSAVTSDRERQSAMTDVMPGALPGSWSAAPADAGRLRRWGPGGRVRAVVVGGGGRDCCRGGGAGSGRAGGGLQRHHAHQGVGMGAAPVDVRRVLSGRSEQVDQHDPGQWWLSPHSGVAFGWHRVGVGR